MSKYQHRLGGIENVVCLVQSYPIHFASVSVL
jgi:hypothetical protein